MLRSILDLEANHHLSSSNNNFFIVGNEILVLRLRKEVNVLPKNLDEFEGLQETRPQVSKVSNEELLAFLSKALVTTKEVAAFLKVENGTAFSRLRRMEKNGIITRRWEGNRAYWVAREAVGLKVVAPAKEEEA